ncbi:ABC transporter substrate-binding protein [Herbidospora cretacea]|uniref:ABC transporter substrate-binding protein n=1 Tax=Herbidospora cretacea TaxID=28444 RepID=UPI0007735C14|nr:ABC transporter substrate-binding protein [Herbidospora cretacea]
MPGRPHAPLPRGVHYLLAQFTAAIATRPSDRPAVLLDGPAAGRLIGELATAMGGRVVPHAHVGDADAEPRVGLVSVIAEKLRNSMPEGAGTLRLPLLETCQDVVSLDKARPGQRDRRAIVRDELYAKLLERRRRLRTALAVATRTGELPFVGFLSGVVLVLAETFPRWVYGVWLARNRSLRWVGGMLGRQDRRLLDVATAITERGAETAEAAVQQVLVTALLRDLDRAARPSRLWVYRRRRRWSFVVLLDAVGGTGSPCKQFLDDYARLVGAGEPSAVLVLGALAAEEPSVAVRLGPGHVADRVEALYAGSVQRESAVYVAPLSGEADDGAAERWIATSLRVPARKAARRDYVWSLAPWIAVATVAALVTVVPRGPRPCRPVAGGEIVGVTDGIECSLAPPGAGGDRLRELEAVAASVNRAVDPGKPHRAVVFYAPVTVRDGSGNTTLNGVQSLRGALLAVAELNARPGARHMALRILLANPGDAFGHGPEVTRAILDRAGRDRVSAVVGVTQSRPASLAAVTELSDGKILVVGSSVTGSAMVEGPAAPLRYFQVSPSNEPIARIMTAYARDVRREPKAIVVAHPDDEIFSVDLARKLEARYGAARTYRVDYAETGRGPGARDAAQNICERVAQSGGHVIYAGRSGRLQELLDAMGDRKDCVRDDGTRIGFLTESMPSGFLDDPDALTSRYPFAEFSYLGFDTSATRQSAQHRFAAAFTRFLTGRGLPAYPPNGDAAGAYDAVLVASRATDEAFALNFPDEDFPANDVYSWLASSGVEGVNGASGDLTLDRVRRFPPGKALYILGVDPVTGVTRVLLECGAGACPDRR